MALHDVGISLMRLERRILNVGSCQRKPETWANSRPSKEPAQSTCGRPSVLVLAPDKECSCVQFLQPPPDISICVKVFLPDSF